MPATLDLKLGAKHLDRGGSVVDVEAFRTSVLTDAEVIQAACQRLQDEGLKVLRFGAGRTYTITSTKSAVFFRFEGLNGLEIDHNGATIVDNQTFLTDEEATLFQIADCRNVSLKWYGEAESAFASLPPPRMGLIWFDFVEGGEGVTLDCEFHGGRNGVRFDREHADPVTWRWRDIKGSVRGYEVQYPFQCVFSGDDVQVSVIAETVRRPYVVYGGKRHNSRVAAKNCSTLLVKHYADPPEDIRIHYTRKGDDPAGYVPDAWAIGVEFGSDQPGTIRGLHFEVDMENGSFSVDGNGRTYKGLIQVRKATSELTPDGGGSYDGKDHHIAGMTVSGRYAIDDTTGMWIEFDNEAAFGTDTISGLKFDRLVTTGGSTHTEVTSDGLLDLTLERCEFEKDVYFAAPNGRITAYRCEADRLADDADTTVATYTECVFRQPAGTGRTQGIIGKTFVDCEWQGYTATASPATRRSDMDLVRTSQSTHRLGAVLHIPKVLTGDLTGTQNVFKLPFGKWVVRLKYALFADGNAAGNCTFGIKSGIFMVATSGATTIQLAVADEVTERSMGTASALTLAGALGDGQGGYLTVACTNYSASTAKAILELEAFDYTRHPADSRYIPQVGAPV